MHNYNIMVLGPSGSGKTVFLGSMYRQLAIQRENVGFFLGAERPQELRLNAIYKQVVSPDREWPEANQYKTIQNWRFDCSVRTDQTVYPAFQFTYLDYAGERLTDVRSEGEIFSDEFEKALQSADVYLALLDGRKVLDLMEKDSSKEKSLGMFVHIDLPSILAIMQKSAKPAHFLITKWDIVEERYNLQQVRDRLMEIPDFRDFVETGPKSSSVRLIPVSSVGSGFAELLPDGQMRKRADAFPHPFQVEIPMACALVDMFRYHVAHLKEKENETKSKITQTQVKADISTLKWIELWVKKALYVSLKLFPEIQELFGFSDETYKRIIYFIQENAASVDLDIQKRQEEAARKADELNKEQKESLEAVRDEQTAVKHVIDSFLTLIERLERDFPESSLR